eukprot:4077476-Amphidinium_carterae.1
MSRVCMTGSNRVGNALTNNKQCNVDVLCMSSDVGGGATQLGTFLWRGSGRYGNLRSRPRAFGNRGSTLTPPQSQGLKKKSPNMMPKVLKYK